MSVTQLSNRIANSIKNHPEDWISFTAEDIFYGIQCDKMGIKVWSELASPSICRVESRAFTGSIVVIMGIESVELLGAISEWMVKSNNKLANKILRSVWNDK